MAIMSIAFISCDNGIDSDLAKGYSNNQIFPKYGYIPDGIFHFFTDNSELLSVVDSDEGLAIKLTKGSGKSYPIAENLKYINTEGKLKSGDKFRVFIYTRMRGHYFLWFDDKSDKSGFSKECEDWFIQHEEEILKKNGKELKDEE